VKKRKGEENKDRNNIHKGGFEKNNKAKKRGGRPESEEISDDSLLGK